jgi:ketosteroid isomerase-like protein
MKRLPVLDEDRRSVAEWFACWAELVADVNFGRVRELFVEDAFAFGSRVDMVRSREALEAEQWRIVWPTMADYRYDLSTLELAVSPDRLMAVAAAVFHSTGFHKDGTAFARPGRVTAALQRTALDAPWLATHTHVSLKPGTPSPSYGNRPEATSRS